jgi:hypothetical protein
VCGQFAYGGLYNLSIVKTDIRGWANRTEVALPPPPVGENGQGSPATSARKRRVCRELKCICATADAEHVVCVCTDGGVIYYNTLTARLETVSGTLVRVLYHACDSIVCRLCFVLRTLCIVLNAFVICFRDRFVVI